MIKICYLRIERILERLCLNLSGVIDYQCPPKPSNKERQCPANGQDKTHTGDDIPEGKWYTEKLVDGDEQTHHAVRLLCRVTGGLYYLRDREDETETDSLEQSSEDTADGNSYGEDRSVFGNPYQRPELFSSADI